jgi:invasion protein IalB
MATSLSHSGVGASAARLCAVAATLLLGATVLVSFTSLPGLAPAHAQQGKKPPAKAGQKKPPVTASTQSAWVKLCEKATATIKNKEGKDEKKELNICLTHHERLDGNSGMVLVSAALRQIDGQEKKHLMVMVPLGMMLQPGMRATIFPKDLWQKVQKNEKIEKSEEAKMKAIKLEYTLCHLAGCTAETEASPELVTSLKTSGGLMVFAISASGAPVAFPVPLNGFEQALAGKPVDTKKYGEARKALMMQIAQRRQELAAELKKQHDALQKMQGTDKAAPKAPPAKK